MPTPFRAISAQIDLPVMEKSILDFWRDKEIFHESNRARASASRESRGVDGENQESEFARPHAPLEEQGVERGGRSRAAHRAGSKRGEKWRER